MTGDGTGNELIGACRLLGIMLLRILVLGISLAYLFSIIEGLRTMGIAPFSFPFSLLGTYQPRIISPAVAASPFLRAFDDFLFLFNCTFPSASRMGSGIGMVASAFWTLHDARNCSRLQRIVIGVVAGAIIGFRLTMMISNSASFVLMSTTVFCLGFTTYMALAGTKAELPRIPLVQMD